MPEKNQKKPNSFVDLVDAHYQHITEEDLKDFLTTRIDMLKDLYLWMLGGVISIALLFVSINTVILNLNIDLAIIIILAILILIGLIFYDQIPIFKELGIHTPFQYQKMIFQQYFEAKQRLAEKKLAGKQVTANVETQNAPR